MAGLIQCKHLQRLAVNDLEEGYGKMPNTYSHLLRKLRFS